MEDKNEYFTTTYGKKVVKIPIEELQILALQVGFLPMDDRDFFRSEYDRLMKIVAGKYGMKYFDVDEQYCSRRRKSVWKIIKISNKEILGFTAIIDVIPRDDLEYFRSEFDKIMEEIAKKYGLIT